MLNLISVLLCLLLTFVTYSGRYAWQPIYRLGIPTVEIRGQLKVFRGCAAQRGRPIL